MYNARFRLRYHLRPPPRGWRARDGVVAGRLDGRGLTLIEILVVLIVMGVAVALVAPAFIVPSTDESELAGVIRGARRLAERRGEIVYLQVSETGEWQAEGGASPEQGVLAHGRLDDVELPTFTLVLSPIGTCAFDVRSSDVADVLSIDPLTCELQSP